LPRVETHRCKKIFLQSKNFQRLRINRYFLISEKEIKMRFYSRKPIDNVRTDCMEEALSGFAAIRMQLSVLESEEFKL